MKVIVVFLPWILRSKILQSDWTKAMLPINCEAQFFRIWVCTGITEHRNVFHVRLLQNKSNEKILRKFNETLFWALRGRFYQFLGKQFLWKIHFCNFFVLLVFYHCKISERFNEQISRKTGYRCTGRWTDVWTNMNS